MTSAIENPLTTTTQRFEAVTGTELIEIKDGLVIYQHEPERVHRLNRSAAVIYLLCDGSRTVDEIAHEVQLAFNTANTPHSAVTLCLHQLTGAELVRRVDGDTDGADKPTGVHDTDAG
jgi:hypothetical protein